MSWTTRSASDTLLDAILTIDNLTEAWKQVRKNIAAWRREHSRGSDDVSLQDFEAQWAPQMERLADELRSGRYQPLPPKRLLIAKRQGGQREIAVLSIRDRIAQRAVLQVVQPVVEPTFLDCSFGFRPLVGTPHAIDRVERWIAHGAAWAAHIDIADCFGSIDHRLLMALVSRSIRERSVLRLIGAWLDAGALCADGATDATTWLERGEVMLDLVLDAAPDMVWNPDGASMAGELWPPSPMGFQPGGPSWSAAGPAQVRRHALRGVLGNVLMLGGVYRQAAMQGLRRAMPTLQRVSRRQLLTSTAGATALALGGLAWRAWQTPRPRGALQGGALSPLLANIYLTPFDRTLTERGIRLVRYADDMLLLGNTQAEVEQALNVARQQLARLRLTLNEEKMTLRPLEEGIGFLGYTLRTRTSQKPPLNTFQRAEEYLQRVTTQHRQPAQRPRRRKERS